MARETFKSQVGSVLALAGSAVGLGNIWRFPYMVSEYGGGAFILVYILCVALVALPIIMCEFVVGRKSHANAYSAVAVIDGKDSPWRHYGILALCIPFFTLCYYSVIGGWTLSYLTDSCMLRFSKADTPDAIQTMFDNLVTSPVKPVLMHGLFLLLTAVIIARGVHKGIEKCSKIMMPMLFIIMVLIAVWTMMQPGASAGVSYLFKPDFSKITPQVFLAAMGQSFYSLSVGMGINITYSSYLKNDAGLTGTAVATVASDFVFAMIAGCAIIPALFAYGMPTCQGTGLVFKALPVVFTQMPLGGLVSIVFFFAVLLAAMTSAMSLFEVPVSWLIEQKGMSRIKASVLIFTGIFLIGVLCSLSFGSLSGLTIGGRILFDFLDHGIGSYLMPVAGLAIVLFVGWKMDRQAFSDEVNGSSLWHKILLFWIKWLSPAVILAIFISGIITE